METKLTIELTLQDGQWGSGDALYIPLVKVSVDGKPISCLTYLRLAASSESPDGPCLTFSAGRMDFKLAPNEEAPPGWAEFLEKIAEEDKLLLPFQQVGGGL